jgi:hypothetical protein
MNNLWLGDLHPPRKNKQAQKRKLEKSNDPKVIVFLL